MELRKSGKPACQAVARLLWPEVSISTIEGSLGSCRPGRSVVRTGSGVTDKMWIRYPGKERYQRVCMIARPEFNSLLVRPSGHIFRQLPRPLYGDVLLTITILERKLTFVGSCQRFANSAGDMDSCGCHRGTCFSISHRHDPF